MKILSTMSCLALLGNEGKQTGQNICINVQNILSNWNITVDHTHVYLRYNVRNIKENKQNKNPCSLFKM